MLPGYGGALVVKLRVAFGSYRAKWRAIPIAILLSFGIHLLQSWLHVYLGRALGIEVPFSYCVIVYPLVGTFSALPVSLNGIGLREGGYLFMLQLIGVSSETAIAFGLLLFLTIAVDSLIGGVIFLLQKSPRPAAVDIRDQAD